MGQAVPKIGGDGGSIGAGLCHTGSLYHWRAIESGVTQTVEAMDVYPVPVFRVFFKKLLSGQERVAISGRAFGIDEHQDQIGISRLGLLEVNLLELEGVDLSGFGDFVTLGHQFIKLCVI